MGYLLTAVIFFLCGLFFEKIKARVLRLLDKTPGA